MQGKHERNLRRAKRADSAAGIAGMALAAARETVADPIRARIEKEMCDRKVVPH